MTDSERTALVAFLVEQRRHYIALAKSCEAMLMVYDKAWYNKSSKTIAGGNGQNVTTTPVIEHK